LAGQSGRRCLAGVADLADPDSTSYHVSKAELHMFTESLANELWPRKIDVNNLVPGRSATTTFSRGLEFFYALPMVLQVLILE